MSDIPWQAYVVLGRPRIVQQNLDRVRDAGVIDQVPNLWQLSLGVLRAWHRNLFRSDTVGTCTSFPVRDTWRAKLLLYRGLRLPFLLAEGAVVPLDLTGLKSTPAKLVRHLMGAHHDGNQFVYDLQILQCYPGKMDELRREVTAVVATDTPRSRWLRDLTVFENYHENLKATVERAIEEGVSLPEQEAADPDISFLAFLDWCARQPGTPAETWRAYRGGRYRVGAGLC